MTETPAYVPGVCNINRAEIAYRRKAGHAGLAITFVIAAILLGFGLSRWLRLALFVPAFIAAIGYLQARNKFCVSYGASGQQNASDESATATKVTDSSAQLADKRRARRMNAQAALLAALATLIVILLPA